MGLGVGLELGLGLGLVAHLLLQPRGRQQLDGAPPRAADAASELGRAVALAVARKLAAHRELEPARGPLP